ncbi:hypothetical protein CBR_g67395, partial [Chara braunii]
MPETGGASVAPKKGLTLDDLIAAIDRHERNPSNIPKVDTFHFCGERVSEWLERVEQALVGWSDVVKFQRILQYVLHNYHQEVKKVIDAAQGSWERFKEGMQRKYRLGDGLLTTADPEAMNKEDFTTIGAFVQEFKKRARKVHGISEEAQCAIFLGLLTASEAVELTRHRGGSTKLTWATIDRGVEVGCLDQVEQRQVRLQRHKRKERDATASGTPGVTRIVTDVLAQLGYVTEPVVTAAKVKGKEPVIEEAVQEELWEEEEPVSQGSVVGGGNQGQGNQGNRGRGGGRGRGRNGGGRGRQWNGQGQGYQGQRSQGQGYQGQGSQGQGYQGQGYHGQGYQGQGDQGSQGYGRPRFDWRTTICQHCDQQGHTIRFCNIRREDERSGLISSTMDENIYDQFGEAIDRRLGGVRAEAQRRAGAGPPPPAMFRLWQEKEEPPIGVEEVGSDEEVTEGLRGGSETEEAIIIESDDEDEEERTEPLSVLFEKMEDLLDKMGRYQQKLVGLCEEVKGWRSNIPTVFLYDFGPEKAPGRPGVNVVGSCPQSGMRGKPLTPQARLAQAARTRNQAKASASQESPRREPEPGKRKEVVEVENDGDEEEEDERLRREEDQRAEQRARKKGTRGEAEPVIHDEPPKKKKYAVRLEEGFDVEKVIDRLLEGHNDLMTLKEILASAPRLRDELKGRLSRRLVPNVHLGAILPKEAEWAESGTKMDWKCVACGTVDLMVRGSKCAAMVDTGAEMNIIREADAIKFGLDIDRSDCGILHGASCKAVFCGTTANVLVEVGKVKVRACFFIMPDVDHGILLGRSFLSRTETMMFNKHDGTLILLLCDPACENYEIITCRNTGSRSIRNRPNPGSFTIEKSEGERRRLWAKPEAGEREEAFSLSLSDVGKAMDLDLQRLNAVTVRDAGGLPNADALSESCAGRPIISLIDLYSGYDQFPVYPPDRPVTAMHTPRGLIHMNVAPQGWTNAVAMVQRAMIRAMQSVSPHITQPYIDDLAVKGPAMKEIDEVSPGVRRFVWKHIQDLEKVLSLLEEHNLTASGAKSRHCMREATILGIVCNEKGRRPDVKNTDKITEWPVPFYSITDVRSFLGTCGFWRAFVKNFAAKTEHLRKLVRQGQEWVWGEEQEEVVAKMKEEFREGGLVLGALDYDATKTRPFIVETDAGPTALGGVLIQADMEGKERPLRFESRTLCTTERNYSQFKRETLAVLHCLRIFRNYIFGRRFILRVDPTALAYSLRNYVPSDPTVARWLTYIWMFNFELERIPGSKNRADGLSRINWDKQEGEAVENTPPVDGFLDQEEDVRLHINKWSPRVPSCVGYPIWQAPKGYERRNELVLKPFEEEDPWGGKDVQWMMELALASSHRLVEDMRTIEEGPGQVERHEDLMGVMYLLVNTLLQEGLNQSGSLNPTGNVDEVPESQDDEFEEGEIKEAFRAEEYDEIYLEQGLLLSCEIRLRDASDRAQRMLQRYFVRDDHLFVRREVGIPRRVVCGRNRQIDVVAALHDCRRASRGTSHVCQDKSDFTKTFMPRGGRGTRPPRRPLGASGGYERHGPRYRESTPVYNDRDIELFLDNFWDHARRMGWTVAQAIEGLRGAGRFEEPIARIRREATTRSEVEWRMQELRPSSVGPDGRPIRLEIGNASDFIPVFEWFMQGQGIPRDEWMQTLPLWTRKAERPLASEVRDMTRDWESCRAHLREAFRRLEPPQPRVERRQRSQRSGDPEPREVRPSRGGRKALARREEEPEREPEIEERGAYPEYGLGPVEFHRFTEGGLRRSPAHTREEPPVSEGPLRELETHLDISQWRASPQDEKHEEQVEGVPREEVPQEEVPREEVPREEAQGTQRESRLGDVGRCAGKEVIEVGEDTPPQTPA